MDPVPNHPPHAIVQCVGPNMNWRGRSLSATIPPFAQAEAMLLRLSDVEPVAQIRWRRNHISHLLQLG
jgi:hypothetical protein